MNYYEHHLGDYAEATAHLTILEDGCYARLLRKIYATERALPEKVSECCRLIGARKKDERAAVERVLVEFFELRPDGWHNGRSDREIAHFQDKQRKAKASADARWSQAGRNANASVEAMRTHDKRNALQTPDTRHQKETIPPLRGSLADPEPPMPPASPPAEPAKAVEEVRASKPAKRCPADFDPDDGLRQWAATELPRVDVDRELATFRDHTFGTARSDWPATFRNWLRKAGQQLPRSVPQGALSFRERDEAAARAAHARWTGQADPSDPNIIDMEDDPNARLAIDR